MWGTLLRTLDKDADFAHHGSSNVSGVSNTPPIACGRRHMHVASSLSECTFYVITGLMAD